jgi:hypothetical protein
VIPLGKFLFGFSAAILLLMCVNDLRAQVAQNLTAEAHQLAALANQSRAQSGLPPVKWDSALAEAALKHTNRMVSEGGAIQHHYPGELELSERAGLAGAHFDLIEENIAVGPTPPEIHDAWMHSPGHRANMLNPQVTRIGIAVVAAHGVLYATEDFSRGVEALSSAQVEEHVAELIARSGVKIMPDHSLARAACTANSGLPRFTGVAEPSFVMRWQDSDLSRLPRNLTDQLATRQYRQAAVGSCQPNGDAGTFTAYRVAVLLY